MTFVKEFLDFLVNLNKGMVDRNGDRDTLEMRKNLANLIGYLTDCVQHNRFNIEKFRALCTLCRPELRKLVAGGYVWDANISREKILKKFDSFEQQVIHFIEHLGEKFQTPGQVKIVIVDPKANAPLFDEYTGKPISQISVNAEVFDSNGKIIRDLKDLHDKFYFYWYIVARGVQAPTGRGTSLSMMKSDNIPIPSQLAPHMSMDSSPDIDRTEAKVVVKLQRKEDYESGKFLCEAQANITFLRKPPQGHRSGYHIPNPKSVTLEEAKLLAAINNYYQHNGCLGYFLKKLHLQVSIYGITVNRGIIGNAESVFFEKDANGHWIICKINGEQEAIAATTRVNGSDLNMGTSSALDGFDRYGGGVAAVRMYRGVHLVRQNDKYKLAEKGYLLLTGYPDPGFPLPASYESLVAREPPIEEPTIKIEIQGPRHDFYLYDNMTLNINFNSMEFVSRWEVALVELIQSDKKLAEKNAPEGYSRVIKNFQANLPLKEFGIGGHLLAFSLRNFFGNGKHLYSNVINIKIIREEAVIINTEPPDKKVYYLNEIIEIRASLIKIDLFREHIKYIWRELNSNKILMEGGTNYREVIIRTPAPQLGEGEHLIAFTLIDVFGPNENLTSNVLKINVVGGQSIKITSPENDPQGQKPFFTQDTIRFKAEIKNFAIISNLYDFKLLDEKGRALHQDKLTNHSISAELRAYNLGVGKHIVRCIIEKKVYPPETVLSSEPINVHVRKKSVLHRLGIKK